MSPTLAGSRFRTEAQRDGRFRLAQAVRLAGLTLAGTVLAACKPSGSSAPQLSVPVSSTLPARDGTARLEKEHLKLGFIKLTDCAPLVIAKELGFFEDEGLDVELEPQANWKVLLDRVISRELDGAHMLAGQPAGATAGVGTQAHVVTAFVLDLNGNAVTVSNRIWKRMQEVEPRLRAAQPEHPITAAALKPIVEEQKARGEPLRMAMVFPLSTHNYELRYWLAAAGIHPGFYTESDSRGMADADVLLSVTPPPQMPATLASGTIDGYCVGEPWNQQALKMEVGVPVTTSLDIWKNRPEKVLGVTSDWAERHPNTHIAVVKALLRAAQWLDAGAENRRRAVEILSRREYVGAGAEVIAGSMTGFFHFQKHDRREMPDFNVFFRYFANYPWYSDCIWYLTQMRRWGQISGPRPDAWYHDMARRICRPDVFREAARRLVEEGRLEADAVPWETDGYKPASADFIDGIAFDGRRPLEYLTRHAIGNKDPLE
jgi:nitrate/nitrite transport system substrate-binding protein